MVNLSIYPMANESFAEYIWVLTLELNPTTDMKNLVDEGSLGKSLNFLPDLIVNDMVLFLPYPYSYESSCKVY